MSLQNHMLDGFYVAYVTGAAGIGQVLFVVAGEKIVGADAGGLKYDGKIVILPGQGGHPVLIDLLHTRWRRHNNWCAPFTPSS